MGVTGSPWLRFPYTIRGEDVNHHWWIKGRTRFGKSKFIELFLIGLYKAGRAFAVIDPHGDLCRDVLWSFADLGHFDKPHAMKKLWYIDFSNPEYSLPWNILDTAESTYAKATNVDEAFKRMFPKLLEDAPVYKNVILHSVIALIENNLPLTKLADFLLDDDYRAMVLRNVTYPGVVTFFTKRYDKWGKDAPKMRESTLNKISILTLSPTFQYAFGQIENKLKFRELMDQGVSMIFNLSNLQPDVEKFIGSLLMVGFEQAALSRANISEEERKWFTVAVDECHRFTDKSKESFSSMLPQTLKYHVNVLYSHQFIEQLEGLEAALGMAAKAFFRSSTYPDAEYSAKEYVMYDPNEIHNPPKHESQQERDFTPNEAYAKGANKFLSLHKRNAIIRILHWNEEIKTLKIPPRKTPKEEIQRIINAYARELLTPIADLVPVAPKSPPPHYNTLLRNRQSRRPSSPRMAF